METTSNARLRALRTRSRKVTTLSLLASLNLQARPQSTAAELIGMVMLDLDRLAYRSERDSLMPQFAVEFMDRRLAGRLGTQYTLPDVQLELQRRFDKALREGPAGHHPGYDLLLARLERHIRMLEATAQLVRVD